MSRVGLFGGSFNPPHVAHQLVALYALETQPIDEVWFIPTYVHAFGKPLAPFEHRVRMCELAAAPLGSRVKVSRAEEERASQDAPGFVASRTFDLLEHLGTEHEFRLLVGTDILSETHKWYRWADVVARAPPIVIGRAGHPLPAGSSATGVTMPSISSTYVRELLAKGNPPGRASTEPSGTGGPASNEELRQLLPKEVLWYIGDHHLYRTK